MTDPTTPPPVDDYGFAAALMTALETFEVYSRHSGRTWRMLRAVNDGDTIVTAHAEEKRRLEYLLKGMSKKCVTVMVVPSNFEGFDKIHGYRTKPLHFDHAWVREFFFNQVSTASRDYQNFCKLINQQHQTPPRIQNFTSFPFSEK